MFAIGSTKLVGVVGKKSNLGISDVLEVGGGTLLAIPKGAGGSRILVGGATQIE